jgi:hypothetical protein
MPEFVIGDKVRVEMPRGYSKRGVLGISVMYTTWPEAKFDGATGQVVEVNPRGPYTVHQYLVDFRGHDNSRLGIPWQSQWFREEWLSLVERRPAEAGAAEVGRDTTGHGVASRQANQPPNDAMGSERSRSLAAPAPQRAAPVDVDSSAIATTAASPDTGELATATHELNGEADPLDELASYAWSDDFDDHGIGHVVSSDQTVAPSSTRRRLRPRDARVSPDPPPTIGELGRSAAPAPRRQEATKQGSESGE